MTIPRETFVALSANKGRYQANFVNFVKGFGCAIEGVVSSLSNERLRGSFARFFKAGMYGTFFALCLFLWPLTSLLLLTAPGVILQPFVLIPFWSFKIAKKKFPLATSQLFMEELRSVDKDLHNKMSEAVRSTGQKWERGFQESWNDIQSDLRRSWHFTWMSLVLSMFSTIPVVGAAVSIVGQLWLVSWSMAWDLMSVYTHDYKKMNYKQEKKWMEEHSWSVLGFTFPFAVLSSIPFAGPFLAGIGQSATAHLFAHEFKKEALSSPTATPVQ